MIESGLGYAGKSTSGFPNTKTTSHRPSIAGSEFGSFVRKNTGIKILKRKAKRKSITRSPSI